MTTRHRVELEVLHQTGDRVGCVVGDRGHDAVVAVFVDGGGWDRQADFASLDVSGRQGVGDVAHIAAGVGDGERKNVSRLGRIGQRDLGADAAVAGEFLSVDDAVCRFGHSEDGHAGSHHKADGRWQGGVASLVGQGTGDEVSAIAANLVGRDGDGGHAVLRRSQIAGQHGVGHGRGAVGAADLHTDGVTSQGACGQRDLHLNAVTQLTGCDFAIVVFWDTDDQGCQRLGLNDDGLAVDAVVDVARQRIDGVAVAAGIGDGGAQAVATGRQIAVALVPSPAPAGIRLDPSGDHDGVGVAQFKLHAGIAAQLGAQRRRDGAAVNQAGVAGDKVTAVGTCVVADAVDADSGPTTVDDALDVGEVDRLRSTAGIFVGDGASTAADQ